MKEIIRIVNSVLVGLSIGAVLIGFNSTLFGIDKRTAIEPPPITKPVNQPSIQTANPIIKPPNQIDMPHVQYDKNVIYDMGMKFQENMRRQEHLRKNPDIMDMPPWENEHRWNRINNKKMTCWYHKITKRKICNPNQ